jgi:hypothetical protein
MTIITIIPFDKLRERYYPVIELVEMKGQK